MGLIDWALNNWYWAVGGYAFAFGTWTIVYAVAYVRSERNRVSDSLPDSERDNQSIANLNRQHDRTARDVLRKSGRRAVRDSDYWTRANRHAADGDSVLPNEKAVA